MFTFNARRAQSQSQSSAATATPLAQTIPQIVAVFPDGSVMWNWPEDGDDSDAGQTVTSTQTSYSSDTSSFNTSQALGEQSTEALVDPYNMRSSRNPLHSSGVAPWLLLGLQLSSAIAFSMALLSGAKAVAEVAPIKSSLKSSVHTPVPDYLTGLLY